MPRYKRHFRKNYAKKNHPAYIYDEDKSNYIYLSLTHSPITEKQKNSMMYKNPNPIDNKASYFRVKVFKDNKKKFSRYIYPWKLSYKDSKLANTIINKKSR